MGRYEDRHTEYAICFWLREKRLSLGLSQRKIARDIGVNHTTVFGWEAGRVFPVNLECFRKWVQSHQDPETGRRCKLEMTLVDTDGKRHDF